MPWLHSGVFVVAVLPGSAGNPSAATHPEAYAGTYAVRICHASCTGPWAVPFVTGTFVLSKRPLGNGRGHRFRTWPYGKDANACFVMKKANMLSHEDDWFPARGFVSWALQENAAYFELVQPVDGGYAVYLKFAPKGLIGKAVTWGGAAGAVAPNSPPAPQDSVVADRIGESDIGLCPALRLGRKRPAGER